MLRGALGGDHGVHAILDVVLEGQQKAHHAVLKEYQLDPRRSSLLRRSPRGTTRPADPGAGSRRADRRTRQANFGGVLTQIVREVTVEALPMAIPDRLELDISALEIGDQVRVSDIVIPEGVTLLDDPDVVAATVAAHRVEVIEEEAPEGVEGEAPRSRGGGRGGWRRASLGRYRRVVSRAPAASGHRVLDARSPRRGPWRSVWVSSDTAQRRLHGRR